MKQDGHIPFSRAAVAAREAEYAREVLDLRTLQARGDKTRRCESLIAAASGADFATLTHSCTAALEAASLALNLCPGDEVIMPSFAFSSIANAVALRGATPVFVDIRADTFNLDEALVEQAITPATRAIYVVHYAGVVAEMDALNAIAARRGIVVVEDAAQAYLATYKNRPAGELGAMGCFSFHETKNVVSGEGGALVTRDMALAARVQVICEKGTNRRAFLRGDVDKYTWVGLGSSYHPGELTAALLLAQLEAAPQLTAGRMDTWQLYYNAFADAERAGRVRRPIVPAYCGHNAHIFSLLLADGAIRDRVLGALRAEGIMATFHFVPLHSAPAGLRHGRVAGPMVVTDDVAARQLRLPLHSAMARQDIDRIVTRTLHHVNQ